MEQQMNSEGYESRNEEPLLPQQEESADSFPEEIRNRGIKSINLLGSQLVITAELSGVFCQGVQYYDLKNILFINNAGMANLIDLLKSLLRQGVQVQFVNVNEKIKQKIKEMGLEHVLICS